MLLIKTNENLSLEYFTKKTFFHPFRSNQIVLEKLKKDKITPEQNKSLIEEQKFKMSKNTFSGSFLGILSLIISLAALLMNAVSTYLESYVKTYLSSIPKNQQPSEFQSFINSDGVFRILINTLKFFWNGDANTLLMLIILIILGTQYYSHILSKQLDGFYSYERYLQGIHSKNQS